MGNYLKGFWILGEKVVDGGFGYLLPSRRYSQMGAANSLCKPQLHIEILEGDPETMSMHGRKSRLMLLLVGALCLAVGLAGCKTDGDAPIQSSGSNDNRGVGPSTSGSGDELPELSNEQLERILFLNEDTRLQPVYFDFDSFDLRADALDTLRSNASTIKSNPDIIIMVHGHCDERGTQAYNLALGEKRALATRAHLINLGVSGDRIITVSHGKEMPADPGHNEAAWAKNRRCEFGSGQL